MSGAPKELAEAPDRGRVLEDVLAQVHLSGSLILRAELTAPWAYESPPAGSLRELLDLEDQQLILFHIIPEGGCEVWFDSGERVALSAGDVVVMPYGHQHRAGLPGATVVPIGDLLPPQPWRELPILRHGGGGPTTQMICGYLLCDDLLFNPFLRALPPLFRVRPPEGPAADWMRLSVRYALEGGNPNAAGRLFELIFVEVLRLFSESLPTHSAGWLSALADPVVGRALVQLHAHPAEPWTVASLASRAATSRSVLDERFRRLLGRAPMRYLTEWRLQVAADLLRRSSLGLAEIASRVGYESEASFNRAFRRELGEPPARWRAIRRAAPPL